MDRDVVIAGVGMIPFTKPGAREPYPTMASTATRVALADARIDYSLIEQAYAGRGIGRAIALKLADEGARIVVNDLDPGPAQQTVDEIVSRGGTAVACPGNVTATDFAERFINTAVSEYKGIDIIVNNAGYTWDNVIQKMTDEQWYAMIDCHLTAPFRLLRAAQPVLRGLSNADAEAKKSASCARSSISPRLPASSGMPVKATTRLPRRASKDSPERWRRSGVV